MLYRQVFYTFLCDVIFLIIESYDHKLVFLTQMTNMICLCLISSVELYQHEVLNLVPPVIYRTLARSHHMNFCDEVDLLQKICN